MRAQGPINPGTALDWYEDQPPRLKFDQWPQSHKWVVVVFWTSILLFAMTFVVLRQGIIELLEANPELTTGDINQQFYDELFTRAILVLASALSSLVSFAIAVVQAVERTRTRMSLSARRGTL